MKRKLFGIAGGLAVVLALGLVLAGCSTDSDDDPGGSAQWPASWLISAGTGYPQFVMDRTTIFFQEDDGKYVMRSSTYYWALKSFTGDGTATGSFKIRKLRHTGAGFEEYDDEIPVEYSLSGDTLTLTFGGGMESYNGAYVKLTSYRSE